MLAICTPEMLSPSGAALLKSVGTVWTPDMKEMVVFVTGQCSLVVRTRELDYRSRYHLWHPQGLSSCIRN